MLNLRGTSSLLTLVTASATVVTHVHTSWVDFVDAATSGTLGDTNSIITGTTGSPNTITAAPSSPSTTRNVKLITISNLDGSLSQTYTIKHTDGSANVDLIPPFVLGPGEFMWLGDTGEPTFYDSSGHVKTATTTSAPAVNVINTVILASDVTNNNASANTIADVTALSFSVTSGQTYWFRFIIPYTSAATTTGSRWSINGPASPTMLAYTSRYPLTATTETVNYATAYDIPAAANVNELTTGNIATIEGFITPSSNGTLIARFASEVSSSAVVAKAGALLQWARML